MRQKMNDFQNSQRPTRNEGDVSIDNGRKSSQNKNRDGEFVDYIEIKD